MSVVQFSHIVEKWFTRYVLWLQVWLRTCLWTAYYVGFASKLE